MNNNDINSVGPATRSYASLCLPFKAYPSNPDTEPAAPVPAMEVKIQFAPEMKFQLRIINAPI